MTSLETAIPQEELIGEKYRLGPVIGAGGIATVRRATHIWTEREVAVKLLDPTLPHFEQLRAGFLREARATVQLDHPNVVDVLDMGEDGWDTVYMVMELLNGPTLRDVLLERGKLDEEGALAILLPLLDALERAHELGIIHRDFKPENIMLPLDAYGVVTPKLLDFGIAEIVRDARPQSLSDPAGVIMGTPQYMSPEQARDHRELIGSHTDVWGVAIVWYECLTGHPPFDADSSEEILHAVCEAPIDFRAVPEKYVPILRDALHRLPGFRMASVSELKARIEQLGFTRETITPAPASLSTVPPPADESRPRKRTLAGLGPDALYPLSPSPIRLDSELITLPTKSNLMVWLAGIGLAAAVAFAAWWTVRDPGDGLPASWEAIVAQPEPAQEVEAEELAFEVPAAEEDRELGLEVREEALTALEPAVPEEEGVAELSEGEGGLAAPEVDAPAEADAEDATPVPAAEDVAVAEEREGASVVAEATVAEATPAPAEAKSPPEAPATEPKKVKPTRKKPRKKAPSRAAETPAADDARYQKPPDLVTEW